MVRVKAGEKKKQLIIDSCKKLFYQNGYNSTTYEMICTLADIAPGSITYHFSSKKDIAAIITNENDLKLREYVSGFVTEETAGHWAFTSLMIWVRWYLFLNDANIRRFFSEIYTDSSDLGYVLELFKVHRLYCQMPQTESDLYLLAATFIGQDRLILNMLETDPRRFSLEQIVRHCEATLYKLIDLEPEQAADAARQGAALFRSLEHRFDLGFFREFRHDTDKA